MNYYYYLFLCRICTDGVQNAVPHAHTCVDSHMCGQCACTLVCVAHLACTQICATQRACTLLCVAQRACILFCATQPACTLVLAVPITALPKYVSAACLHSMMCTGHRPALSCVQPACVHSHICGAVRLHALHISYAQRHVCTLLCAVQHACTLFSAMQPACTLLVAAPLTCKLVVCAVPRASTLSRASRRACA